ncbi:hypothetical protein U1701_16440 [Sphingomonas sp. PB2P19]|uniref:hypothetical protein n=1 Tax=Sphingomonas rhamnosi TaxID=3096156 RepID=UPI002FCC89BE
MLLATGAYADTPGRSTITVTANAREMSVQYDLPREARSIALASTADGAERTGWTFTPGFAADGSSIRRTDGASFRRALVTISPDTKMIDRVYPQALRVGEGWQLYVPYLRTASGEARIKVRVPHAWIVAPSRSLTGTLYVGPRDYLQAGIVAAPAIPGALRSQVGTAFERARAVYTRRLAITPPGPPLVIIALDPTLRWGWRGDSTPGALSLRFAPDAVSRPVSQDRVARFVAHELFHDWWQGRLALPDGERGAWIEEGMAEYAGLLASGDDATISAELARHLNGCSDTLAPAGLLSAPPISGQAVYDCGTVFQWVRDLQLRRVSHGREDAFTGWSDLLRRARRTHAPIPWAEVIAVPADVAGTDAAKALLGLDADRWPRLVDALNGLGAHVLPTQDDSELRIAILKHLLTLACRDRIGFFTQEGSVKLDTGDRCGPLNGNPVVDAIAGHKLFTDAAGAFDAVAALCASDRRVSFENEGRAVAELSCGKALPPAPKRWAVRAWRSVEGETS